MKYKPYADYLKYWRAIKTLIRTKHKLSTSDIDILLFVYSEGYFRHKQFWSSSLDSPGRGTDSNEC